MLIDSLYSSRPITFLIFFSRQYVENLMIVSFYNVATKISLQIFATVNCHLVLRNIPEISF